MWGECIDATTIECDPVRDTGCMAGSCTVDEYGVPSCP
jgi:hypothetical protein